MLAEGGECGVTSHPAKYKVLVFHNLSLFLSFNQATCYSDVSVVLNVPHGFRKTITKRTWHLCIVPLDRHHLLSGQLLSNL